MHQIEGRSAPRVDLGRNDLAPDVRHEEKVRRGERGGEDGSRGHEHPVPREALREVTPQQDEQCHDGGRRRRKPRAGAQGALLGVCTRKRTARPGSREQSHVK